MDATSSPPTTTLLHRLQADYPVYHFVPSDHFRWSPSEQTIYFDRQLLGTRYGRWDLLHELAHAELEHTEYNLDVSLIAMEAAAWHKAKAIALEYRMRIANKHIQEYMDTYRHWLDTRSNCPTCQVTGIQKTTHSYQCLNCRSVWRVNDAKFCMLRRVRLI